MKDPRISNHKLLIYQVFTRTFSNSKSKNKRYGSLEENGCGKFNDINDVCLSSIAGMGYSHIWYTGVIEHASCEAYSEHSIQADSPETVKGRAGSPYAIRNYYNVSPDLAENITDRLEEFKAMVDRTHKHGMKVIIDHVPNHVARLYQGEAGKESKALGKDDKPEVDFDPGNDFYYIPGESLSLPKEAYEQAKQQAPEIKKHTYSEVPAKVTGNDHFSPAPSINDWYETVKINYGVDPKGEDKGNPDFSSWRKMKDILLYWASLGVDGFRCDMAGMVPLSYWQWVIKEVKDQYDHILFIAEIYEPWKYQQYLQAGFDYLYDKEGFYNTCRNVVLGHEGAGTLSRTWQESGGFDHRMLRFMENHDEERIASRYFCGDARCGIPAIGAALFIHKGPAMVYAGQELGEKGEYEEGFSGPDGRSSIFDYWGIKSLQGWNNNGAWDGERLIQEQKSIRKAYLELLKLSSEEDIIKHGELFDLQYAQEGNESYDQRRCFSFIRHHGTEAILFILWFGNEEQKQWIHFPEHLFQLTQWLGKEVVIRQELPAGKGFNPTTTKLHDGLEANLKPWSVAAFRINPK